MRHTVTLVVVLATLFLGGCNNKVDSLLDDLEKKPTPTTVDEAKALVDEVANLLRHHQQAGVKKLSPEQASRAARLLEARATKFKTLREEALEKGIADGTEKVKDWVKSLDIQGNLEWFLGKDAPERTKYGGPAREPTDPKGAEGWK